MILNDLLVAPNIYFISVMLVLFTLAVCFNQKSWTNQAPALLTSLGIMGTFLGLYLALHAFDGGDINRSVPELLKGIKTKFLVSLVGIGSSFLLKIIFMFIRSEKAVKANASLGDLLSVLTEIRDNHRTVSQATNVKMEAFKSDCDLNFKSLQNEFKTFGERVANDNSKALIEALKEVIRDFNTKISEQFGDNFKELNTAVGRLLDWQDKNKDEMSKLHEVLSSTAVATENATGGIAQARDALNEINTQMALVTKVSSNLAPTLEKLNHDSERLQESIQNFAEMGATAKTAFPLIRQELNNIIQVIERDFTTFKQNLEATFRLQSGEHDRLSKALVESANQSRSQMELAIRDIANKSGAHLERIAKGQEDTIKNQLAALDKGLEEELTKALMSLGNNLANLSEKFVSDYSPLTERLQSLVRLVETKTG